MKIVTLIAVVITVTAAQCFNENQGERRGPFDNRFPPYINRPQPPSNYGYRFRRSPEPELTGSISFDGSNGRPTWNLDYDQVWKGKNGEISVSSGISQAPGRRLQPHINLQGGWRFRRSAEPEPKKY